MSRLLDGLAGRSRAFFHVQDLGFLRLCEHMGLGFEFFESWSGAQERRVLDFFRVVVWGLPKTLKPWVLDL